VGLLWTTGLLVAEAANYTKQNKHKRRTSSPQLDWTHDRSNWETADLRLRPHGHRECQYIILHYITFLDWMLTQFRYQVKYRPGYRKGLLCCSSTAVTKTSKHTHTFSFSPLSTFSFEVHQLRVFHLAHLHKQDQIAYAYTLRSTKMWNQQSVKGI